MDLNKECIHLPGYQVKYQTSPIDGVYMYVYVCVCLTEIEKKYVHWFEPRCFFISIVIDLYTLR